VSLSNGEVEARMSLFAAVYFSLCALVSDDLEGIYRRKELFQRESFVHASNFVSYYLTDGLPIMLLFAVGSFCAILIVYLLTGLRSGMFHFGYFYGILLFAVYCNHSIAYALSMVFHSLSVCKTVFIGVILPLQLLTSGYLVLIPSSPIWMHWTMLLSPMSYFLAGCLRNEFQGNDDALGSVSFGEVEDQYGLKWSLTQSVVGILVMAVIYRTLWLLALRMHALSQERAIRRKVIGVRKSIRRSLSSVLHLTEAMAARMTATTNNEEFDE
jgi:hypothetical protein